MAISVRASSRARLALSYVSRVVPVADEFSTIDVSPSFARVARRFRAPTPRAPVIKPSRRARAPRSRSTRRAPRRRVLKRWKVRFSLAVALGAAQRDDDARPDARARRDESPRRRPSERRRRRCDRAREASRARRFER
jgi:hypothetical protein